MGMLFLLNVRHVTYWIKQRKSHGAAFNMVHGWQFTDPVLSDSLFIESVGSWVTQSSSRMLTKQKHEYHFFYIADIPSLYEEKHEGLYDLKLVKPSWLHWRSKPSPDAYSFVSKGPSTLYSQRALHAMLLSPWSSAFSRSLKNTNSGWEISNAPFSTSARVKHWYTDKEKQRLLLGNLRLE